MWDSLNQNLALMICLVPLVGAVVVLLLARWGQKAMQISTLLFVLISCTLTGVGLYSFHFASSEEQAGLQGESFQSEWQWPGRLRADDSETNPSVPISVRFGLDGKRLCYVALISLVMIPVACTGWFLDERSLQVHSGASWYFLVLVAESLLFFQITSLNLIPYLVSLELLILVFYFLTGIWGGKEKLRVNRKYLQFQTAGVFLIMFGLILAFHAHSQILAGFSQDAPVKPFDLVQLVNELPELTNGDIELVEQWNRYVPWVFWSLLVGFFILSGLFPFHTWFSTVNSETPGAVAILLSAVSLKLGFWGMTEILFPMFPRLIESISHFMVSIFLIASIYTALLTLAQDDLRKIGTYLCLSQLQLAGAGLFLLNPTAHAGVDLMLLGHGLAFSVYFYSVSLLESRFQTREMEAYSGLSQKYVRWSFLFGMALFSLVGVPGFIGFAGNFTLLIGLNQARFLYLLPVVLVLVLHAWAIFWMIQRVLFGEFRVPVDLNKNRSTNSLQSGPPEQPDKQNWEFPVQKKTEFLVGREFLLLVILVPVLILGGLFPMQVLNSTGSEEREQVENEDSGSTITDKNSFISIHHRKSK